MDEHEMDRLKQKLELLGEPALPARLTAEELFRRMDSGELALPEEETTTEAAEQPEKPGPKVIPWVRVMKRGLPVAACLALVLLLYRGQQTVFAKNFSGGVNLAADQHAPAAAAPGPSSSMAAEAEVPEFAMLMEEDMAEDATADTAPEEPSPEPSPRMSTGTTEEESRNESSLESTAASENRDTDRVYNSGEAEQKQKADNALMDKADAGGEADSPDTVEEDGVADANPGIGWGSEDEIPPIFTFQELMPSMLAIAAENAPSEEGTMMISWSSWNNRQKDKFVFTVHYQDNDEKETGVLTFYCHLDPEAEVPEVTMDSCREGIVVR